MRNPRPPRTIMLPAAAVYRADKLPPELMDTWLIVLGAAYVNAYRYTPPLSLAELTGLHFGTLQQRALVDRLQRLEQLGWLAVTRASGIRNVYSPIIPPERASFGGASSFTLAPKRPPSAPVR